MNPHTATRPAAPNAAPADPDLIAVWPDETWCAAADIPKMRRADDYLLMRVTRRSKDGSPLGFERVVN